MCNAKAIHCAACYNGHGDASNFADEHDASKTLCFRGF